MTWFIPREHGAWSMWITPYMIGAILTPWSMLKLSTFIAILFLYMAFGAIFVIIRSPRQKQKVLKSAIVYSAIGLIMMSVTLYHHPLILLYAFMILPLLLVNVYFAIKKKERLMTNDIVAVTALSITGLVAYHLGTGIVINVEGIIMWGICVLFFIGSIFFVKSLIRERTNNLFKIITLVYHIGLITIPVLLSSWWLSLVFLPSFIRALMVFSKKNVRPMVTGITEVINSIIFVILMSLLF